MNTVKQADKLGSIIMIELRDAIAVPRDTLQTDWQRLGLPTRFLPSGRNARDAFRKATPRSRRVNGLQLEPYRGPALEEEDLDMAVVMTRVQDAKTRISKRHENRIVIGLTHDGVLFVPNQPTNDAEVKYLKQIEGIFARGINAVIDGTLLRNAVKKIAEDAKAFTLKGGVYMFPETSVPIGEALVELATCLNPYVTGNAVPNDTLVVAYHDTPLQRNQLKAKLDTYIKETLSHELNMIRSYAARSEKPVGERKKTSVMQSLAHLGSVIAEHELVLQEELHELNNLMRQQQAFFKRELAQL